MAKVTVRLSEEVVAEIDRHVAAGRFPDRSAAVRAALDASFAERDDSSIDASIVAEYTARPQSAAEVAAARRATVALILAEPW